MFSGSYVGATQMLAAIGHPPHLAGICPIVTASNYHENWSYQGGAFEQWFNESWTSGLAQDTAVRQHDTRKLADATNALIGDSVLPLRNYPLFNSATQSRAPTSPPSSRPTFSTGSPTPPTTTTGASGPSKKTSRTSRSPPSLSPPGTTSSLRAPCATTWAFATTPATPRARANQRLVVAIGGHSGWGRKIGEVDFGPDAPFDENEMVLEWYDSLFLGKQNQFADAAHPVKVFTMGANEWRGLSAWPPPEAKPTRYLLSATTAANSATGGRPALQHSLAGPLLRLPGLRPRQSRPHRRRSALLRRHPSPARPARPKRSRSPPRRPRLLDPSTRRRPQRHRPRHARALRLIHRRRYRLHRQARRRLARRLRPQRHRGHPARKLPRFQHHAQTPRPRQNLQTHHRHGCHFKRFPQRP
jgi:hypothetical protein